MGNLQYILLGLVFSISIISCGSDSNESDASSAFLYNIDFESPTHSVGEAPTTGLGPVPRDTVTEIKAGTPLVAANFGVVVSQSLDFDSSDLQGDQIGLSLDDLPSSNIYCFEADILVNTVSDPGQPFAIIFDTPQIRTINFHSDGIIQPFVPLLGSLTTGTYSFDTEINIKVEIDLTPGVDGWQIFIDDALMHSGGFGGATAINSIRVTTPVTPDPTPVLAAIDNIRVSGEGCLIN